MQMFVRRVIVALIVIQVMTPMVPKMEAAPLPFPDMEWSFYRYKDAVQLLKDRRIVQGNPDGTFRPKDTVNRAEFLKMLFAEDRDIIDPDRRCFSDVNPREWYAPYVCTAKLRTIVEGYPDGSFKPGAPMNMAEAMKMAMGVYGLHVQEIDGTAWYTPYADELNTKGILSSHSYIAWEPVNRERAADLIWRLLRYKEEKFIARQSPGCTAPRGDAPTTVQVFGEDRTYLLNKPRNVSRTEPASLVIAFHGRTNSNEQVRGYYGIDRALSDSYIAYPAALRNSIASFSWANPGDKPGELRDLKFFDTIVETLAAHYCIDMDRISVVGHSLGAWMANSVACVRGDVVLASATVGGDGVNTECAGPASALIAHNPNDNLAPFSGSERVRDMRMKENQCDWSAATSGPAALHCTRYPTCGGNAQVLWCPYTQDRDYRGNYYPHTWPNETASEIKAFLNGLR